MTKKADGLRLADKLTLPIAVAGDSLAIIARKGRGKTYAASVLAEEMLESQIPIVVLDPQGDWWGLRSSADGKKEGYSVVIMGGEHADIRLEPTGGKVVADFVLNERVPTIIDMSEFDSRAEEIRFASAFMARLFQAKKRETGTLHLFVDEASTFAPQSFSTRTEGGEIAKMVGAAERVARRGRRRGLGSSWIDQRAASVNKNVLSQAGGLLVLGLTGTQDRKAIREWVEAKAGGAQDLFEQMMNELPGLSKGGAYFWWPDLNMFERTQVRSRRTFDSSSTPEPGVEVEPPKKWSEIDSDALDRAMADTREREKADDPKELRKRIVALQKDLAQRPTEEVVREVDHVVEVPVFEKDQIAILDAAVIDVRAFGKDLLVAAEQLAGAVADAKRIAGPPKQAAPKSAPGREVRGRDGQRARASVGEKSAPVSTDAEIPPSRQRILDALAWMESIGRDQTAKSQLALLADQRPTSGGYKNNLGALRSAGLIDYPQASWVALTDAGRAIATAQGVPTTSDELQAQIMARLGASKTRILKALIDIYPEAIDKTELAELSDQTPTSGGYKNNLGFMRTMGLIEYPSPGYVVATPILFLDT